MSGSLPVGTLFAGRYFVEDELGKGGMGTVYRVQDELLGVRVALKMLRRGQGASDEALTRFRSEARLARRVTHENVARTFDIGEHDGTHYLTLEYVEGVSLKKLLRQNQKLGVDETVRIGRAIARGLTAAHAAGVVHRDLKPANVLIDREQRVVIVDFGVAASELESDADSSTHPVGTPAYMAPEQLSAGAIDGRADLYALGLISYELLVGARPFAGAGVEVARAKVERDGPDPRAHVTMPAALGELICRLTKREPSHRPASAAEVARAFDDLFNASLDASTVQLSSTPPPVPSIPPLGAALAVLPFRYRGPSEHEFLGDALTEELIDWLSRLKGVRVFALTATEPFRNDRDPRRVAAALGADQVVDATIERGEDDHRIKLHLIDGASGVQLWNGDLRGPSSQLVSSERLAMKIAETLRLDATRLGGERHVPAPAQDDYLRGRRAMRNAQLRDTDACRYLERALEHAPDFDLAIAAFALASVFDWTRANSNIPESKVRERVTRALAEADGVSESHLAAGILAAQSGDYASTVRFVTHALDLAPTSAGALTYLGMLQVEAHGSSQGVQRLELAADLDPGLPMPAYSLARHFALHRDWDRFERWAGEFERLTGYVGLLRIRGAAYRGEHELVRRMTAKSDLPAQSRHPLSEITCGYLVGELDATQAESRFEQFVRFIPNARAACHMRQFMAETHAHLGALELAMSHIRRTAETLLADLMWLDRCPLFDPLRERPDFEHARRLVVSRVASIFSA